MLTGERNYDLAEVKRLAAHERATADRHREAGNVAGLSTALASLARYQRIVAEMETKLPAAEDSEFLDVRHFHIKYDQVVSYTPSYLTKRKAAERANFLLEELNEYAKGAGLLIEVRTIGNECSFRYAPDPEAEPDLAEQADALIDLVYVAKGTAVMNGLPWKKLWDDVQGANMRKVPGTTKRGNAMDVTKPPGWVGPKTLAILMDNGFDPVKFMTSDFEVDEAKCVDDACHKVKDLADAMTGEG